MVQYNIIGIIFSFCELQHLNTDDIFISRPQTTLDLKKVFFVFFFIWEGGAVLFYKEASFFKIKT